MIPVMLHLDHVLFDWLETVAKERGTNMRDLILTNLRTGMNPERHETVLTSKGRTVDTRMVTDWVAAAHMGVSNKTIGERWGVSPRFVGECLKERGFVRQTPRKDAA